MAVVMAAAMAEGERGGAARGEGTEAAAVAEEWKKKAKEAAMGGAMAVVLAAVMAVGVRAGGVMAGATAAAAMAEEGKAVAMAAAEAEAMVAARAAARAASRIPRPHSSARPAALR
jgi:hypothetical protein